MFDAFLDGRCMVHNFPWLSIPLGPVVQKVDSTIQRINLYPVDSAIGFPNTYPPDSDLSGR